jgi:Ran GTPase-activating protein (RanGAP) involved in mRNA processing and transport
VECEGMKVLAKALAKMPSLKILEIHQNFIREKGMVLLFNVLKTKKNF